MTGGDPDLVAEALDDPHGAYAALSRRAGEAGVVYEDGTHYVLTADLVRGLSRDPRLRARGVPATVLTLPAGEQEVVRPVEEFFGRWLAFCDAPRQTRVRRALAPCLTRAALVPLLAGLPAVARSVADEAEDLVADVARPLSRWTTGILLSATADELDVLVEVSSALIRYLGTPGLDVDAAAGAATAIDVLRDVVTGALIPRRGPVAAALADLAASDPAIDETDVMAAYAQLLTGAMEPLTTALVGTLLAAADEGVALLDSALAADPPFHFAPRVAAVDLDIDGHAIRAGERVVLNLFTAGAELAAQCPHAGAAPRHLAFGVGTHYCLGVAATRLHVELVLPELVHLVPRIRRAAAVRARVFGASAWERVPLRGRGQRT